MCIDYQKIRSAKTAMIRRFLRAKRKAEEEGTIVHKPLGDKESND